MAVPIYSSIKVKMLTVGCSGSVDSALALATKPEVLG